MAHNSKCFSVYLGSMAFNSSEKSEGRDRSGSLGFFNKRSEWWWRMREALDPAYGEEIALPPDSQLRADLCAPRWRLGSRGIQVESKEDIFGRIGRSTEVTKNRRRGN